MRAVTSCLTVAVAAVTVAVVLPALGAPDALATGAGVPATTPSTTPTTDPTTTPTPTPDPSTTPEPSPAPPAATQPPRRRTWTFGHSVQGRPLRVTRVGDKDAPRRTLVVGCLHGNECDGVPVVDRLRRSTPPKDTAYYLVRRLNPDGARRGTRHNARGVDLNRNFPADWRPNGRRWSVFYPGPRPRSEPETRAAMRLVKRVRPTFAVWYHQRMDLVDHCGGSKRVGRTYARHAKQRFTRITKYRGTATRWQRARHPGTVLLTVELPDRVTTRKVRRHVRAVHRASARVRTPTRG